MSPWHLKSPASRLFTQPFVQAQIKENIKAACHWPLWGEFTGDRWISVQRVNNAEKCFHSPHLHMYIAIWPETIDIYICIYTWYEFGNKDCQQNQWKNTLYYIDSSNYTYFNTNFSQLCHIKISHVSHSNHVAYTPGNSLNYSFGKLTMPNCIKTC